MCSATGCSSSTSSRRLGMPAHHVAFFDPGGACYAGDALGCLIPPASFSTPPLRPRRSTSRRGIAHSTRSRRGGRPAFRLAHFGVVEDPRSRTRLHARATAEWADRASSRAAEREFVAAAEEELEPRRGRSETVPSAARIRPHLRWPPALLRQASEKGACRHGVRRLREMDGEGRGGGERRRRRSEAGGPSKAEPGVLLYQPHRDPENPNVFFFYEQYTDAAAYQAHVESEHFKQQGFGDAIPRSSRGALVLRDLGTLTRSERGRPA